MLSGCGGDISLMTFLSCSIYMRLKCGFVDGKGMILWLWTIQYIRCIPNEYCRSHNCILPLFLQVDTDNLSIWVVERSASYCWIVEDLSNERLLLDAFFKIFSLDWNTPGITIMGDSEFAHHGQTIFAMNITADGIRKMRATMKSIIVTEHRLPAWIVEASL